MGGEKSIMTKNNVEYDEEDIEFVNIIRYVVEHNGELEFECGGKEYRIDYVGDKLCASLNQVDAEWHFFDGFDDLMDNFLLDGIALKDRIPDIGDYGVL